MVSPARCKQSIISPVWSVAHETGSYTRLRSQMETEKADGTNAKAAAATLVAQQSAHAWEIMSTVTSDTSLAILSVSPVQYHVDPTPIARDPSTAKRHATWAREMSPCLAARHATRSPEIETTAAGPTAYQNYRS